MHLPDSIRNAEGQLYNITSMHTKDVAKLALHDQQHADRKAQYKKRYIFEKSVRVSCVPSL
jgi:hypothetical protein